MPLALTSRPPEPSDEHAYRSAAMTTQARERLSPNSFGAWRIEVARDFAEVEDAWRFAGTHSAGYVFQCYQWVALWHATVGRVEGVQPLLVRVTDPGGRTLLFLPLGIQKAYGCRILVFLGGRAADYNAPLIDPVFAASCGPADFADLWRAILRRLPRVDLLLLERMPEWIETIRNPMATLAGAVHTHNAHAAAPLPPTFEAFTDARRRDFFKDTARQRRKLATLAPVRFEIPTDLAAILDTVELMLIQKRRRNRESGSRPLGVAYEAFYRKMATSIFDAGSPHVSRLWVGDTVVATHVGAVHRTRFYYLMPGYEAGEWSRYSVGRLLQQEVVGWCISQRLETFDMTVGDEGYKRFWADTTMRLYTCRCALSRRGHAALAVARAREWARRNQWIRQTVARLRRLPSVMRTGGRRPGGTPGT